MTRPVFEVAIYADLLPRAMLSSRTATALARIPRLDALHVGVHSSRGTWRWSEEEWGELLDSGLPYRMRPVAWPRPAGRLWTGADAARLERMAARASAVPVLDLEHQWPAGVPQVADHELARRFPTARITTHLHHPIVAGRNGGRLIAREAASLEVQALGVSRRRGRPVPAAHALAPPRIQLAAMARGEAAHGGPVYVTLPAYGQAGWLRGPGRGPVPAMESAFAAAYSGGALGVAYWSLRHVLANSYAQEFLHVRLPHLLESLRFRAPVPPPDGGR